MMEVVLILYTIRRKRYSLRSQKSHDIFNT